MPLAAVWERWGQPAGAGCPHLSHTHAPVIPTPPRDPSLRMRTPAAQPPPIFLYLIWVGCCLDRGVHLKTRPQSSPLLRLSWHDRQLHPSLPPFGSRGLERICRGHERRAFQASVTLKYCRGIAGQAEKVFGWGRQAVALGLNELRTNLICYSARQAFSGNKLWEEKHPEAAEVLWALLRASHGGLSHTPVLARRFRTGQSAPTPAWPRGPDPPHRGGLHLHSPPAVGRPVPPRHRDAA